MGQPSREPFHFLLVEDDRDAVLFFKRALAKTGIPAGFHVARSGEEAVHYLSGRGEFADRGKHPLPCLMVLDLRLPKLSGLEVLEWMQRQPKIRQIPAVVLTTSTLPEDIRRATELGARAYWTKPADLRSLDRVARKISVFLKLFCDRVRSSVRGSEVCESDRSSA